VNCTEVFRVGYEPTDSVRISGYNATLLTRCCAVLLIRVSFPACHWLRYPIVSNAASYTPFYVLNQPSFHTVPLNHIFNHSLNHMVLDTFIQPSYSAIQTLSAIHSQLAIQAVSQTVFRFHTYSASQHAVTQPFILSAFQILTYEIMCCISVSLFRPLG
jgi:hypothetical protein